MTKYTWCVVTVWVNTSSIVQHSFSTFILWLLVFDISPNHSLYHKYKYNQACVIHTRHTEILQWQTKQLLHLEFNLFSLKGCYQKKKHYWLLAINLKETYLFWFRPQDVSASSHSPVQEDSAYLISKQEAGQRKKKLEFFQ